MREITPALRVGTVAEFGAMPSTDIVFALATWGWRGFDHSNTPALAVRLDRDGTSPDWLLRDIATLVRDAMANGPTLIVDEAGGSGAAAAVAAAALALASTQARSVRAQNALTTVRDALADERIPQGLRAQVQRVAG